MAESIFKGLAHTARIGISEDAESIGSSEFGVGALMAWNDSLYIQTYHSNKDTAGSKWGQGAGLFKMGRDRRLTQVHQDDGCHPARFVHYNTSTNVMTLFMGVCRIDQAGTVTPIPALNNGFGGTSYATDRICGYCRHWDAAKVNTHVLAFGMSGYLYEINISTLTVSRLENAGDILGVNTDPSGINHGKSIYKTLSGRIYVTFNNDPPYGRIGRWNGSAWVDVDPSHKGAWINVDGATDAYGYGWATGHDDKSALLMLLDVQNITPTSMRKFRLPYNTESWKPYWNQEWMRLRQVESERFLLDAYGNWYELSNATDAIRGEVVTTAMPRINALGSHSRIVPDFCTFDGALVLGGNHESTVRGAWMAGQAGGSLEFTTIDALAQRRPTGHGYWWRSEAVTAALESDPMLARGFGQATVNIVNSGATSTDVTIYGWIHQQKITLATVTVAAGAGAHYETPTGYRCDWVSVKSSAATTLTARIDYV